MVLLLGLCKNTFTLAKLSISVSTISIGSRIRLVCAAYNTTIIWRRNAFNQWILPVMMYRAETWTLTIRLVHKLSVHQRAMERAMELAMSDIFLSNRIRNEAIEQSAKVTHIGRNIRTLKWKGAGHGDMNRWSLDPKYAGSKTATKET